jgi:hypothetical protein
MSLKCIYYITIRVCRKHSPNTIKFNTMLRHWHGLVYPMLPVSLDCHVLLVPSVLSNVYLLDIFMIEIYSS